MGRLRERTHNVADSPKAQYILYVMTFPVYSTIEHYDFEALTDIIYYTTKQDLQNDSTDYCMVLLWHSTGVRKTFACFGGRIWKLAVQDRSVAAFNTALSCFRFSLKYPVSSSPLLYLTMAGLANSAWFVSMPGAWTIRLACSFPIILSRASVIRRVRTEPNLLRCLVILIGRRSFSGFEYFSVSLINLTKGTPK